MDISKINGNPIIMGGEALLEKYYKEGRIYFSTVNESPASFIGGTWERIEDVFLLCAGTIYAAGTRGGEANVTLTIGQMPRHSHSYDILGGGDRSSTDQNIAYEETWNNYQAFGYVTGDTGGNQPHNNMPPYEAVYAWVCTA